MKLSIITINYNNFEGLKKTFDSVFNQTFQDFEYIVIDGGSTDGSKELIEFNKDKISYWVSEPDKGIYNAMNKGIKVAKGEYLLFLNSGDYFYEQTVLKDNFFLFNDFDIIYFRSIIKKLDGTLKTGYVPNKLSFSFFFNSSLNHQSILHKKSLFEKYGYYDEELEIVSDWKFLLLALCKFNSSYRFVDNPFTVFEMGGVSNNLSKQMLLKKERDNVLKDHFEMFLDVYQNREKLESIFNYYNNSKRVRLLKILKILKK
ncbi:glycosyl transferase [Cloacibacterium rupense]|uniref:Glycosyl transferase n=1 Tax=Cloacibacterium rupense TaxID=517423 RepID=A0ABQ2NM20_9FLAO|nr:glycosyltransferase family 2 protein [Cloacibacterium rupense]GGP05327.1 glycosyl transferase [Cloacibacterium rupense]